MRVPWHAALLIVCSLIPASLSAQQPASTSVATPTSDPQAVALLQRALRALTGVASVTDVTLTGTARRIAGADDENGTATLKATALGDSRVDLVLPSGNRTEIRSHSAFPLRDSVSPAVPASAVQAQVQVAQPAGAWSGPDGTLHGVPNHNLFSDPTWFFPSISLATLASSEGYVFSYVGQESHDGQLAVHLSLFRPPAPANNFPPDIAALMQHLSQMDLYLDPTTLLPMAVTYNIHPDNNAAIDLPAEIRYSGYQTQSGVQIPFHVQKYLNNGLVVDLHLGNAVIDSGLLPTTFDFQ